MFGSLTVLIAIVILAMLSAGGLAYALLYGRIETERNTERRLDHVQTRSGGPDGGARAARPAVDPTRRRKSIQETLRDVDERQTARSKRSKSPPLSLRIEQAGLSWSRRKFILISIFCGLAGAAISHFLGLPLYAVGAFGIAALLGVPRWGINFLRKRRMNKFLDEFANAVDVIVRGVKAGLPLNDCLKIIGSEAQEPVRTEFRMITETQGLGVPLYEAISRLPERMPVPEANFFAIVITIQQSAGGNLSEALGNLSKVLRDRRKMKGKIQAMSMEAKASASIIGALPIIVMGLVYLTSPAYISLLFTDPVGNVILGASALWMLLGILVMRNMIRFDF